MIRYFAGLGRAITAAVSAVHIAVGEVETAVDVIDDAFAFVISCVLRRASARSDNFLLRVIVHLDPLRCAGDRPTCHESGHGPNSSCVAS